MNLMLDDLVSKNTHNSLDLIWLRIVLTDQFNWKCVSNAFFKYQFLSNLLILFFLLLIINDDYFLEMLGKDYCVGTRTCYSKYGLSFNVIKAERSCYKNVDDVERYGETNLATFVLMGWSGLILATERWFFNCYLSLSS